MRNFLKRSPAVLLAVLITLVSSIQVSPAAAATTFTDIKSTDWYYSYVNRLVDTKITAGIGNNKFGPNNTLTRAEFVTFLCKATGITTEIEGYTYSDTENHWAKKWISVAVNKGMIDKGNTFNPDKPITRQEVAEMLCRSLNLPEDFSMKTPYVDVNKDSGYINAAYKEFLLVGTVDKDGKRYFNPGSTLKRSEAAATIINMIDYRDKPELYTTVKKAEIAEAEKYSSWVESVKGISPELLSNIKGLDKPSIYESNKSVAELGYFENWGKDYGMTEEEFAKEIVRVGTDIMHLWYNADYRKLDDLENGFRKLGETNFINNSLKRNLDFVKDNKFVSEGSFKTSTGLIVADESGAMRLRGTIRYRYLSPTSSTVLNSEILASTGKSIQLGVWYEQDYQISFYPESKGLKFTGMWAISDVRIAK